jgi:hypothetical protein
MGLHLCSHISRREVSWRSNCNSGVWEGKAKPNGWDMALMIPQLELFDCLIWLRFKDVETASVPL